jgi:LysM repeat protein
MRILGACSLLYVCHGFRLKREIQISVRMENEMNKSGKVWAFITFGAAILLAGGCAGPKIEKTAVNNAPEDTQVVKAVDTPTVQPTPVVQRYTVKAGDTLWAIASQSEVYSDNFQWPEIFKTDRDLIKDPDQIFPGQILIIQQGQSPQQVDHARQLAKETPAYVKHAGPRSPLPIDYF